MKWIETALFASAIISFKNLTSPIKWSDSCKLGTCTKRKINAFLPFKSIVLLKELGIWCISQHYFIKYVRTYVVITGILHSIVYLYTNIRYPVRHGQWLSWSLARIWWPGHGPLDTHTIFSMRLIVTDQKPMTWSPSVRHTYSYNHEV